MRGKATERLLNEKSSGKNGCYWVEFLGDFASKNRTEDSIYSTAMALNALLDTWGLKGNKSFKYLPDTPAEVKDAVSKGISFLTFNLNAKKRNLNNAFFSGSVKILMKNYPPIYPANKILDKNSTPINAQTATLNDLNNVKEDCMKGFIEDEEYQRNYRIIQGC